MKRIGYTKDRDGKTITLIGAMADCGNVQKAYNKVCTLPLMRCNAGYTTGTSTIKTSHYTQSKRTYTTISRVSRMRYLRQKSEILSRTSKRLY